MQAIRRGEWGEEMSWWVFGIIFTFHALYAEYAWRRVRQLRRRLTEEIDRNRLIALPMKSPMGDTYSIHGTCKHCGAGCSFAVVSVPR